MNKISELISLPVITIYESKQLGLISNILFDYKQKKCKYAVILNDDDNIKNIIKITDIFKIGKECVFLKNKTQIQLETNCLKELESLQNPINLPCYNLDGEYIGTCTDIIINDNFYIEELTLSSGKQIKAEIIFNIGEILLINNKKISINQFKPRLTIEKNNITKNTNNEQNVIILENISNEEKLDNKIDILQTSKIETQNTKIITDYRFLIGRILNKDIIAFNGEILAKQGSTINKDIVNKASNYGKLVEIARYSVRK